MASKKISALDAAAIATTTMQVPVNDSGTNKRVTLAQVQTLMGIPFTHSTSEQVWPFEKWLNGETIYVRTWQLGTGDATLYKPLTGLAVADVGRIHSMLIRYTDAAGGFNLEVQDEEHLFPGATYYEAPHWPSSVDYTVTVWYTKV